MLRHKLSDLLILDIKRLSGFCFISSMVYIFEYNVGMNSIKVGMENKFISWFWCIYLERLTKKQCSKFFCDFPLILMAHIITIHFNMCLEYLVPKVQTDMNKRKPLLLAEKPYTIYCIYVENILYICRKYTST